MPARALVRSLLALPVLLAAWAGLAAPAQADGFLVPTEPNRPVRGQWAVKSHRVDVSVQGPHARITVEEEFVNLGRAVLEAEYLFPLPQGAMVGAITLFEGDRALEGRLLAADDARRAYEEIVRRQKDPALLEYLGRDLYRVSVFPIPAGQSRKVRLHYEQVLAADGGTYELRYPLNTEKFSAQPLHDVSVRVDVKADGPIGPVYSPTHDVAVARPAKDRAQASFEARDVRPDTDFLLYWSVSQNDVGASLLTWWPRDEDRGYFLFLASPTPPDGAARASKPKQITFVVDTSGSMAGEKMEQARAGLRQVLGALNDGDVFNVIAYDSSVRMLWPEPRVLSQEGRAEALEFVAGLKAIGGTNIEGALSAALTASQPAGLPSAIVFLTDGRPTIGITDPDQIAKGAAEANRAHGMRIFVLGVGVDVNAVLLDRLALENHGVPAYVLPGQDVEVKVGGLYEKLRYPVLTDLRLDLGGIQATEMLPAGVPDLFRGSQVVIAGRYAKGGRRELVLAGKDGAVEREYHYLLDAAEKGQGVRDDFPARVWATRRIAFLVDQVRLRGHREPELIDEIVRLSTKFGILTEYTAFLADERVDHMHVAENTRRAGLELESQGKAAEGGAGLAQSANQEERRGADRAPGEQRFWRGARDDRDVEDQTLAGVRQVANRTFYRRAQGWVDVRVANADVPAATYIRWSPAFFDLLKTTTPDENARLAQEGDLVLEVQGRVVRVVGG
jgi:Ca-activated chloride channel family protein